MQVVYCIYPGNSQPLDRKDDTITNASEIKKLNTIYVSATLDFLHVRTTYMYHPSMP